MKENEQSFLYQSVGNQIRLLRKKSGFSQAELADALGLSRASVVNIEKGRQHPSLHLLIDLSRIFNVAITDFLTDETWKNNGRDSKISRIKKEITKSTKGDSRAKVTKFLKDITS